MSDRRSEAGGPSVTLRPPAPGDLGWIVQAHGALYAAEYGFDRSIEGMVAQIIADFVATDAPSADGAPGRQRCWIATRDDARAGSILCTRENEDTARLRCLLVHPDARGLGLGARLVETCVGFARDAGYERMVLTTVDLLHGARRLYQAAGFRLVSSETQPLFGRELTVQEWAVEL